VEAFGNSLPNLAAATKIWRKLFDNEKQLASDAYAFLSSRSWTPGRLIRSAGRKKGSFRPNE
jgi:hypothetical protein